MKSLSFFLLLLICSPSLFSQIPQWTKVLDASYGDIKSTSEGILFATDPYFRGIYRSTDHGNTWSMSAISQYPKVIAIGPQDVVYAAGSDNAIIFKSTNLGVTWYSVYSSGTQGYSVTSMHVAKNGYVYAGTKNGNILISTNQGSSWNAVPISTYDIDAICSTSTGEEVYASGGLGPNLYKSTNHGVSWNIIG
jgi:hypothetical protein